MFWIFLCGLIVLNTNTVEAGKKIDIFALIGVDRFLRVCIKQRGGNLYKHRTQQLYSKVHRPF